MCIQHPARDFQQTRQERYRSNHARLATLRARCCYASKQCAVFLPHRSLAPAVTGGSCCYAPQTGVGFQTTLRPQTAQLHVAHFTNAPCRSRQTTGGALHISRRASFHTDSAERYRAWSWRVPRRTKRRFSSSPQDLARSLPTLCVLPQVVLTSTGLRLSTHEPIRNVHAKQKKTKPNCTYQLNHSAV